MESGWLTFDCFGTLVDWRHGIATTAELLFPGRGWQVLEAYQRVEPAVQGEASFRRYRMVLTETLRRAAGELALPLREDDADALATSIPYWPVFPDVERSLGLLRSDGWRLALLTNCDRDLIALTQRRLPVPFDAVVTAEDVRAYKPAPAHFRRFEASIAPDPARWIHVAQSYFHDIRPASELGIRRIWVNRQAEREDPSLADATLADLSELPEAVASVRRAVS
jgi:2-haloacid dehalogenase